MHHRTEYFFLVLRWNKYIAIKRRKLFSNLSRLLLRLFKLCLKLLCRGLFVQLVVGEGGGAHGNEVGSAVVKDKDTCSVCLVAEVSCVVSVDSCLIVRGEPIIPIESARNAVKRDACLLSLSLYCEELLVGGGKAAYYLADQLLRAGIEVKIIEKMKERVEKYGDEKYTVLLCHDPEILPGQNGVLKIL